MRKELKILENLKNFVVNRNAQAFEYENWSDDFKLKEIREGYDEFMKQEVDFTNFSKEELLEIGFSMWDEKLILMPLWAFHICIDDTILTSIDDDEKIKGKDEIDTDIRFGCLAWGFNTKHLLKDQRKRKLEEIEKPILEEIEKPIPPPPPPPPPRRIKERPDYPKPIPPTV